nr:MAG TPA: hypothetical protein [Caudoviricetes sp.]
MNAYVIKNRPIKERWSIDFHCRILQLVCRLLTQ